jgi:hypothetical protein
MASRRMPRLIAWVASVWRSWWGWTGPIPSENHDRVACERLAREVDDEFRDACEVQDDLAYASAPVIDVRVVGDESTIIAGPNCRLPDGALGELEVAYRQRLRGEGPPAR